MKYIKAIILVFFAFTLKAQLANPLDTIQKDKRKLIEEFGRLYTINANAEAVLNVGRKNLDVHLDKSTVEVPNENNTQLIRIKSAVIPLLKNEEFANYILAKYSRFLSTVQLKEVNKVLKTKKGKVFIDFLRKKILNPNYVDERYEGINGFEYLGDIYGAFYLCNEITGKVFENLEDLVFEYIRNKDKDIQRN